MGGRDSGKEWQKKKTRGGGWGAAGEEDEEKMRETDGIVAVTPSSSQ